MNRIAIWPVDALRFAWLTREEGFIRSLIWVVRQMWRRAGALMLLEPLWAAYLIGMVSLAVVVVLAVAVFVVGAILMQMGG